MKTIPKICHLYWDLSPMALLQTYTITTFHKLNPDWKIIVYVIKQSYKELGDNTFVPNYTGEDYFYKVRDMDFVEIREIDVIERGIGADKHSILGSDIFRMQALYETGGVYCDFDVIWIKPMDHFSNVDHIGNIDNFESIVSFYEYTKGHHNISILMSAPGSSYIKSIIEEQKKTMPPYQHQSFGTFMLNNLYPDLNSITTKYPKVLAVKYDTFYPYSIYDMERLWIKNDISVINDKNVMCIHWFNGHRLSKDYINGYGYQRDCSMTTILKKEGYIHEK